MNRKKADVFAQTEDAARASLSRIIRNSEAGWLFYAPDGTAYHLLTDEAQMLEMRGNRRITQISRLVAELALLPGRSFKAALAVLGINLVLVVSLGNQWMKPFGDFVNAFIFPSLILFALFFAFFRPLVALALRSTMMLFWQRSEARKLKKAGRGAVPKAIEEKHDRYNLFRLIRTGAIAVLAVRFATMWLMTPSQVSERGFIVELVCIGIVIVTSLPAKLVDKTHTRRKWLD